jgi:cephalosporin-C deacetylase
VLAAVALKDTVCPAKQFFAAYNRIDSTKEIIVYPYNGHEDACRVHFENKLRWLAAALVPSPAETGW